MRPHRMLRWFVICLPLVAIPAAPARAQWQVDGGPVCTAANIQANPAIVADGSGGTIIVWQDLRGGTTHDIYAQHVLSSGAVDPAWPVDGRALCTALNDQNSPAIVSDGAGGAIVTWQDLRGGSTYNIYAQHVLASGAVDPAWPADGRALCSAADDQGFPQIVGDGAGGAIVTWSDLRAGFPNFDIYAHHVLASGAVDPAWPTDGRVLTAAANSQESPRIASDALGGAIVTWSDFRDGTSYDIYAQRVLASGAVDPAWTVDGSAVCTAAIHQFSPTIIPDGSGGAIISWYDVRNGDFDIYAHRIQSSGAVDPAWPADGRALCTAAGHQRLPQLIGDGAGGAIVTWYDGRGVGNDIYAHHVQASGTLDLLWPTDGRALCTATNNQFVPQIVADGSGGAIVTWKDLRNGINYDVYAQHVQASGAVDPAWPTDGSALCTAANDQDAPVIASDGVGGAVVAWYDFRGVSSDIYAQRVYASGGVAEVSIEPPLERLGMLPPYPNPSRGQSVAIPIELSSRGRVSIEVLDLAGHRVRTLADGELPIGRQLLEWDGRNDARGRVPAGVYFVRIRAGAQSVTRRTVLLD